MVGQKILIISIDVEVGHNNIPEKRLWGDISGKELGVRYISKELEKYGYTGTFFVNVYESKKYGEDNFIDACRVIQKYGSEVQLHTHPDGWTGDQDKRFMYQYSLEEQESLICDGKKMIGEWAGKYPTAHRAGSLAFDLNTITACKKNGIYIDSSYAYGWKHCRLSRLFGERNSSFVEDDVSIIPITTYQDVPLIEHVRHFDINASSWGEIKKVMDLYGDVGTGPLTMLMHSFSFVEKVREKWIPRHRDLEKFSKMLEHAKKNGWEVMGISEFDPNKVESINKKSNAIALKTGIILTYLRTVEQYKRSRKSLILLLLPWVLLAIIIVIFQI